jgi:hypothetical protein
MARPWRHSRTYHEWPSATPVVDAIGAIVGAASVVIGGHATVFLAVALRDDDADAAVVNALLLVAIAVANALLDGLRLWRRHHG